MIVGALLDAGADPVQLRTCFDSLALSGYSLSIEKVKKQGFASTRFYVALDETAEQPHRHLKDILAILDRAKLPDKVREGSGRIFSRLAEAEAKVHGTTIESVHFHEVGAVDAILDIVGAVAALELLDIERIVCSPIPTGSGTVKCAHGVMPIPAPATAELLKGVPIARSEEVGELTTPTAAAILTTLADEFGPLPSMCVEKVGYGAGTREGRMTPNLLRVLVGRVEDAGTNDCVTVLEANLDDTTGELIGHCIERLFEKGALDAYAVPIQMKKSRPGVVLTVLCKPQDVGRLERVMFTETTTLGVRRSEARRSKMVRRFETVETHYGPVRMKVAQRSGIVTASPEFEDCKGAAKKHDVAVRVVMDAAQAAWAKRTDNS